MFSQIFQRGRNRRRFCVSGCNIGNLTHNMPQNNLGEVWSTTPILTAHFGRRSRRTLGFMLTPCTVLCCTLRKRLRLATEYPQLGGISTKQHSTVETLAFCASVDDTETYKCLHVVTEHSPVLWFQGAQFIAARCSHANQANVSGQSAAVLQILEFRRRNFLRWKC
jgi:hypothetical protein